MYKLLILLLFGLSLVGDFVYSYDTVTGEIEQSEVVDTFIRESDHLVYVTAIDEDGHSQTLETTDEHPFWVVETETWVAAKDLRVGDIFLDANGKIVTLQQSCRTEYEDGVTVYNFEIAGNHNYVNTALPQGECQTAFWAVQKPVEDLLLEAVGNLGRMNWLFGKMDKV